LAAVGAALTTLVWLSTRVTAQVPEPWVLYGHDSREARTITIDTTNGLARPVGPSGFAASSAGLEASGGPVPSQGGVVYPKDTAFGIFRDDTFNKDYVIVLDNATGKAVKTVELDLGVGGRGVAFGPDGVTLFAFVSPGQLYRINTVNGALTLVGNVVDDAGTQFAGASLQFDPVSQEFLALGGSNSATLIRISPTTAKVKVIAPLNNFSACTITRVPGPVAGPGGKVYPAGTFFTINNRTNSLHALSVDTVGLTLLNNEAIGTLGPNAGQVCGSAFSLAYTPWVTPTLPPTATTVPTATVTPTTTRTPVATIQATATSKATAPPSSSGPTCVCREVYKYVPPVVIVDALSNPARYYGWQYPLDMGKPRGPNNPPRECLTLANVASPYHPLWNRPVWKVGCPSR
jgi:hypothetical protein